MNSSIFLDRVRFYAHHGVMEQERSVGGDFEVSLRIDCDIRRAMTTDDVSQTVNYAQLCDVVARVMEQPSQLLEHVAGRIARDVFSAFPGVTSLQLKVVKLNPPMGFSLSGAGVELTIDRAEADMLSL